LPAEVPSKNDTLMQSQADIIGRPVLWSSATTASALGATYLAGLAVGMWRSLEELGELLRPRDHFAPEMADAEPTAWYAG
jgi:glycerol kinase